MPNIGQGIKNQTQLGILLLGLLMVVLATNCQSNQATDGETGQRISNAELMFITRGSLEGEIAPNG